MRKKEKVHRFLHRDKPEIVALHDEVVGRDWIERVLRDRVLLFVELN